MSVYQTVDNDYDNQLGSSKFFSHGESKTCRNILIIATVSTGGIFMGYYMTILNSMADPLFVGVYGMSIDEKSSTAGDANMLFSIGCLIGALITGKISESIGRRKFTIILDVSMVAVSLMYLIKDIYVFYFARFLSGIVSLAGYSLCTILNAEILPRKLATMGNAIAQLVLLSSVFLSYIQQNLFSRQFLIDNWRYVMTWLVIVFTIKLIAFPFIVRIDTAKYYISKNSEAPDLDERLRELFLYTHRESEIPEAISQCKIIYAREKEIRSGNATKILTAKTIRKRLIAGILVGQAQQLSGQPYLGFYSTDLFNRISGNGKQVTFYLAIAKVVGGLTAVFAIKFIGRKKNLLGGILGQGISLAMMVTSVMTGIPIFSYVAAFSFMSAFAVGVGGSFYVFLNEILPPIGVSVSGTLLWLSNSIVSKVLPIAAKAFGDEALLIFYSACCFVLFFILDYFIIETRGKSEKQILDEYETKPYRPLDFS